MFFRLILFSMLSFCENGLSIFVVIDQIIGKKLLYLLRFEWVFCNSAWMNFFVGSNWEVSHTEESYSLPYFSCRGVAWWANAVSSHHNFLDALLRKHLNLLPMGIECEGLTKICVWKIKEKCNWKINKSKEKVGIVIKLWEISHAPSNYYVICNLLLKL